MNVGTALTLGRVSNLPTVWTNALAGVVLAGGAARDGRIPWLVLALSLCYVAGMFLNDAFDREFDARHRPERPIPSGKVSAAAVFAAAVAMLVAAVLMLAWIGHRFAGGTGWRPVIAGLVLAAAIVYYDWHHKQNPLSPFVMGLCRMLVYVTAGFAIVAEPPPALYAMGGLLLCYLVGLTYIARQEHLNRLGSLWPLAFLAAPLLWGLTASVDDPALFVITLACLAWVAQALSLLWRRPRDVPGAVGRLLAGISLWDAVVLTAAGQPAIAIVAVAFFVLTLLLQRYVSPT